MVTSLPTIPGPIALTWRQSTTSREVFLYAGRFYVGEIYPCVGGDGYRWATETETDESGDCNTEAAAKSALETAVRRALMGESNDG